MCVATTTTFETRSTPAADLAGYLPLANNNSRTQRLLARTGGVVMNHVRSAVAIAVAAALSSPVIAQQTDDERVLQEIIVTATKRESSLQDVPFSVAAMTNESIRESGATNVVDLARNVA